MICAHKNYRSWNGWTTLRKSPWCLPAPLSKEGCYCSQNGNILAGSLKTNELRLYENNKCVDVFNDIPKHLYSVATSSQRNECVVTYAQGDVAFFTY